MKIQIWLFSLLLYVLCSQNSQAQFTSKGIDFFISTCGKENFYNQALEIVRRYQDFEKSARTITTDKVALAKIVQEKIMKEDDELFLYRRKRNEKLVSADDKLRYSIIDMSFDIVRTSSLKVFSEYRIGGDDVRLKRRLHENCLDLVNKMISSQNQ